MARDTILQPQTVRICNRRRANLDVSDNTPNVVRTRDSRQRTNHNLPIAEKQPPAPAPSDTVAASAQQLADAAGAILPIFDSGIGPEGDLPAGAIHLSIILGEGGNIIYLSGETIIRKHTQAAEATRALFIAGEQTVTEARSKLAAAIKERDSYQQAVDSKLAVWQRAIAHSDAAYATVTKLKKAQADAQAEAVNATAATGIVTMPNTVSIGLELQAAEQAFDVSGKARATVLADLQELKTTLARAEKIVLAHAFEVTMAESSLLAEQARYAISIAEEAFAALFSLEAVSVRYGGPANANGHVTRPQVVSSAAIEIMRKHMPNGHADATQTEAWAEYVTRLTKDSTATKEQP